MSLQTDFEDLIDALETNLQTKGVTDAQFDSSTGVMGLVSRILDIPSSPSSSISLTSNKSILSKADGESAILTATITNNGVGVTDELVLILRDDVVIGLATDNNDGTYSYEYESEGVGDISFTATNGSITSNVYIIEDCTRYDTTEYSDIRTLNWSLPSGNFLISYKIKPTSRTSSYVNVDMGTDSNNQIYHGQGYANGKCGMWGKLDGTMVFSKETTNVAPLNEYSSIEYSYVNGLHTFKGLGETLTGTNSSISLPKIFQIYVSNNCIKDVLIKPLQSIDISVDNPILSYADFDTATLTATHSKGCGEVVKLYNASNDSLFGVMTDNRDGTYSYTYNSQGIGDISFYAKSGNLKSETITIEDIFYYNSQTISSTTVMSLPIPDNQNLKVEFDLYKDVSGGCWIEIGNNSNNIFLFGCTGGDNALGIFVKSGGYYSVTQYTPSVFPVSQTTHVVYTLVNNVHTVTANGTTKTVNNSQITGRGYQRILISSPSTISHIKIRFL